MASILNLPNNGLLKTSKNLNLTINHKTSRGVSADSKKKSQMCQKQLTFNKLVAQTNKQSDRTDTIIKRNQEKIHSMSPSKKINENTCLIPPQPASKVNKKTLILDLDETLIHSGFRPFEGGNDIVLKVIMINNIRLKLKEQ
jgi:TFIIF-interacting CTD phosphatase-like protein